MTNLPRLFPPEDLMTDADRRRKQELVRILSIGYRRALAKVKAQKSA